MIRLTGIRKIHRISFLLFSLTLSSFLFLISRSVLADSSIISNVTIMVPVSCNLSTDTTLDSPHSAVVNNGTYQEEIGTTNFKVFCNDNGGFSVYAIGHSNEEFGNTKLIATIGGSSSPVNDISTGTAISGNDSQWAMKVVPISGTYAPTILSDTNGSFSDYHVVPDEYTKIATLNSNTDFTVGSSFQTTYRAYISPTQLAGSYEGKVRYTLVHPASEAPVQPQETAAGKIGYYPNASGVIDSMSDQSASANAEITLWASNFKRDGHGFAGWNTEFDYSGTTYGPNETITAPTGLDTKGLSLYAVWVKSAGNLQSWTGCNALNIGDVTALTDIRDNDTYAVAKLADGKCWMIENLRLDNTASGNANGSLAQGYNTNTFKGLADAESPWAANSSVANSLYSTDGANNTFALTGYNQGFRFPRYNNDNTKNSVTNVTDADQNIYGYGNYYTWSVAVGDTTDVAGSQSLFTSICPKGWHLPTGGDNGEFYDLNIVANSGSTGANNGLRAYPNNFVRPGYIASPSFTYRGRDGRYWTNKSGGMVDAYALIFSSAYNVPGTVGGEKHAGSSIRCITD